MAYLRNKKTLKLDFSQPKSELFSFKTAQKIYNLHLRNQLFVPPA